MTVSYKTMYYHIIVMYRPSRTLVLSKRPDGLAQYLIFVYINTFS